MNGIVNLAKLFWTWLENIFALPIEICIIPLVIIAIVIIALTASSMLAGQIAEQRGHAPHVHMWLGFFIPFIYPAIIWKTVPSIVGENAPKPLEEIIEKPKITPKKAGFPFKPKKDKEQENPSAEHNHSDIQEQTKKNDANESDLKNIIADTQEREENSIEYDELAETRKIQAVKTKVELKVLVEEGTVVTKEVITKCAMTDDGDAAGPFIFTLIDGTEIKVFRISDALDIAAVLELELELPGGGAGGVIRMPYSRIRTVVEVN